MLVALLTGLLTALVTLPFVAGATPYLWAFLAARCCWPACTRRCSTRPGPVVPADPAPSAGAAADRPGDAAALAWSFGPWVFYGLQIWLLATRLGAPRGTGALLAVGGFAFAWSVGFLVVFAPAGAGVREVLLVAMLGPVLGVGAATAVALVSRVLTTAGDLLAAGLAAGYVRWPRNQARR